jgi:hypothetical protein
LRWLSEHKDIRTGKLVLVAPAIPYTPRPDEDTGFFDCEVDPDVAARTVGVSILYSVHDLKYRQFHQGHFTYGAMKTDRFPELLEELLG